MHTDISSLSPFIKLSSNSLSTFFLTLATMAPVDQLQALPAHARKATHFPHMLKRSSCGSVLKACKRTSRLGFPVQVQRREGLLLSCNWQAWYKMCKMK